MKSQTAHPELDFRPSNPISVLPVEIEEQLLGGILIDPDILPEAGDLPVAAFSISNHRLIFKTILDVHRAGRKPELNTVALYLEKAGTLREAGGRSKLASLVDRTLHSGNVKQHANLIRENYQERRLRDKLARLVEFSTEADFDSTLEQVKEQIAQIERDKYKSPDDRLKLELQALLQESDPIKKARHKAEICSFYRLSKAAVDELLKYLEGQTRTARSRGMDLNELFDLTQTGIDYLIPGMLPCGETVLLAAEPKAGKSLLAYDAAFAIATGEDTFLGETTRRGRVLIVQCDESVGTAKARLIKRGFRHEDAPNVRVMVSFSITQLADLEKELEEFRPSLVVLDNLRRISAGLELSENSSEFSNSVYQLKELLTQYGAAGILIHHTNKDRDALGISRVRGSSAIAGAVWGVWQLDHIPKPDPNNKKRLIVDPKDPTRIFSILARDVEGQRLKIELDPEANHWLNRGEEGVTEEEMQEQSDRSSRILELLKPIAPLGMEARELNEALGLGRGIYSALNRLVGKRIIGTRPSTTDRRHTVYFLLNAEQGDTPSPPLSFPNEIEYPESHTSCEFLRSISNRSQIDLNRSQPTPEIEVDINSTLDTASNSEIDLKFDLKGGEREVSEACTGISSDTMPQQLPSPSSVGPLTEGDRVRINCPGSKRHGKTATVKRLKKEGKVQLADLAVDGEGFRYWEAQLGWLDLLKTGQVPSPR